MNHDDLSMEPLKSGEMIPYNLLLLADESVDAINKYLSDCVIYVIRYSNDAIGVCAVQLIEQTTIEIKNLAITEAFQNKGVGSWCLGQVERMHGDKDVLIGTGDGSLEALRFYERNGYSRAFTRKNFFIDNYPNPISENGIQLKDQIVLMKKSRR